MQLCHMRIWLAASEVCKRENHPSEMHAEMKQTRNNAMKCCFMHEKCSVGSNFLSIRLVLPHVTPEVVLLT